MAGGIYGSLVFLLFFFFFSCFFSFLVLVVPSLAYFMFRYYSYVEYWVWKSIHSLRFQLSLTLGACCIVPLPVVDFADNNLNMPIQL